MPMFFPARPIQNAPYSSHRICCGLVAPETLGLQFQPFSLGVCVFVLQTFHKCFANPTPAHTIPMSVAATGVARSVCAFHKRFHMPTRWIVNGLESFYLSRGCSIVSKYLSLFLSSMSPILISSFRFALWSRAASFFFAVPLSNNSAMLTKIVLCLRARRNLNLVSCFWFEGSL